jgi:hypothetical protein
MVAVGLLFVRVLRHVDMRWSLSWVECMDDGVDRS